MWTKKNIPDLKGKTAIVTGGNSGIEFEISLALYEAGANVLIAGRDGQKNAAAAYINENTGDPQKAERLWNDAKEVTGISTFI